MVIGLKWSSYFPLIHLPSCYRTVYYWRVGNLKLYFLRLIGNKTSCRPIPRNSVCNHTRDKQIGLPLRGLNHLYDYRPNWTPLSPITII